MTGGLTRLIRPESIAFIGGEQIAGPIRVCRRGGFQGEIFVVNPKREAIEGIACVPMIEDLPYPPDAALIAMSPGRSIEAVGALASVGAGGAVVIASGFAELGEHGEDRQRALQDAAGLMPVLGPNCMGVLNQFDGAAVWGDDSHIERIDAPGAAIVSQSGALLIGITNVEVAFPLGYAISIGNQAVCGMAECIEAVLDDKRVNAIGLYVEGLNDGEALGRACRRAMRANVPVVALKGGDGGEGARVALSHTASMVLERDLWEAFCRRYGIVEISSPKALVETLKLLTTGGPAKGNRLALISYSGGLNGLAATRAGPLGLALPQPDAKAIKTLKTGLPETVDVANPFDLNIPFRSKSGPSLEDPDSVAEALVTFCGGWADQLAFFLDIPRPGVEELDTIWSNSLKGMPEVAKRLGIPCAVAGILPEGLGTDFRQWLAGQGVAALCGYSETMEALSANARLAALHERLLALPPPPSLLYTGPAGTGKARMLDEASSKRLLQEHGLVTPVFETAPPGDAAKAAERIGYPVAIKAVSDRIAHKAKLGGVRLGLASDEAVAEAVDDICSAIAGAEGGHDITRVLVEEMVGEAAAEVIIGVKRHPAMGLAMMIGTGGVLVEETGRFETVLLPLIESELQAALERLKLGPFENPACESLMAACQAVAAYAEAEQNRLVTLDVNPVMLTEDGRAVAADALVVLGEAG